MNTSDILSAYFWRKRNFSIEYFDFTNSDLDFSSPSNNLLCEFTNKTFESTSRVVLQFNMISV